MHEVTTTFKPKGVPKYEASDALSVTFAVDDAISMRSGRLDERACREAVEQGVVDRDILERYWEVYRHNIRQSVSTVPLPHGMLR